MLMISLKRRITSLMKNVNTINKTLGLLFRNAVLGYNEGISSIVNAIKLRQGGDTVNKIEVVLILVTKVNL